MRKRFAFQSLIGTIKTSIRTAKCEKCDFLAVSIPYRDDKNLIHLEEDLGLTAVSIPYRDDKNVNKWLNEIIEEMFQSLIGTIKTH